MTESEESDSRKRKCPRCGGTGSDVDYEGLEMRPVEVDCYVCNGTGYGPTHAR